jgi:predicted helicase
MLRAATLTPKHKLVKNYYSALKEFESQKVTHESAVRSAFQTLLADSARLRHWTLIPELGATTRGRTIVPDGTVRDRNYLPRGYWEAKDTADDLDAEIRKKIERGYPTVNIIFEDSRRAVLYQDKREALRADLTDPQSLCDLVNQFHEHTEPEIETFEKAVEEFKDRVSDLGQGLRLKIEEAHSDNKPFQAAFDQFLELCRKALNPNLSRHAVDEMLIQHLLTERLFRTVFNDPDFTRRNVIAAEVENVIDALISQSFTRQEFLRSLDRFYVAIEGAARNLPDFSDKQHFLNTVYERFFQGYSVKVADTHGIVYTPQPIVDFMCASVEEALKTEFGLSLSSPEVLILDPCTGTGNFIVNVMRRIPKRDLPRMYREQLFANEIMLLPYYIAALNIEHAYYELTGKYEPFEGLCFVDSLDLAEHKHHQRGMYFVTEKNTERVERQKKALITVIIGNPPYNANQVNENDNNKNRTYGVIDERIKDTYARDSKAVLKNKLYDPYIKFFRWASDRLEERDGIVCLITNNNFVVDETPFDGMRKHLQQLFSTITHVDLDGNVHRNPKLSGTVHNVFGIKVGVGVTLALRQRNTKQRTIRYTEVPSVWRKEAKLNWLASTRDVSHSQTVNLIPDKDYTWLVLEHDEEFSKCIPLGIKAVTSETGTVFRRFSPGAKTNRDEVVYGFERQRFAAYLPEFINAYNEQVDRLRRAGRPARSDGVIDCSTVKWSSTLKIHAKRGTYEVWDEHNLRRSLYRPYCKMWLYYSPVLVDRPGWYGHLLTGSEKNKCLYSTSHSQVQYSILATDIIPNEAVGGRAGSCFPFYAHNADGSNRRENITDWALEEFRKRYRDSKISKWDIFYYVYGILHHPGYRKKFADNLKRELPRIPFAPDFRSFAKAGEDLARWHLDYEKIDPYPLQFIETKGVPLSYRVEDKMRLNKTKTELQVNPSLTLRGIPEKCFDYRLGNRSALDWVVNQYQVTEHKRSGIRSDPNREDDPEYIVRLVGQVIRVSLETVRIVESLPKEYC